MEAEVGDVLMGQGRQLGSGPNPARQSALAAGLPNSVPASTFNRACGSSLETIWMGARRLALGEAKFVIAGGMESMTNIPYLLPKMRDGYRLGHGEVLDGNYKDGFFCPLANMPMGRTAENLVDRFELSRQEQDEYALQSFQRWEAAEAAGHFADERAAHRRPWPQGRGHDASTSTNTGARGRASRRSPSCRRSSARPRTAAPCTRATAPASRTAASRSS